jgi:hypothetical protein
MPTKSRPVGWLPLERRSEPPAPGGRANVDSRKSRWTPNLVHADSLPFWSSTCYILAGLLQENNAFNTQSYKVEAIIPSEIRYHWRIIGRQNRPIPLCIRDAKCDIGYGSTAILVLASRKSFGYSLSVMQGRSHRENSCPHDLSRQESFGRQDAPR